MKVRTFLGSLSILLSLAACGGAAPASSTTAVHVGGDPISLQFGWAPATRMSVVERTTQAEKTLEATYDMAVEQDPKGLRVKFSNVQTSAAEGGAQESPDAILAAIMTAVRSDLVVSTSGALSSVEFDAEQLTAALQKAMPPDATEEQKGMMMGMAGGLARMAAEGQAREDWGDLIETWSGKTFKPGAEVKAERVHQLAMLGDVPFDVSVRLEGTLACPDGQGTCAKLVFDSVAKPNKSEQGITVKMRRHFELVADVATLLPQSSVLEVDGMLETEPGQGEPIPATRVERTYKRL